ncbi:MAG: NAD(P)H-hydrate dehydratase [Rhodobacteraceae bacterium]|nr:NAD(P)H-hydrate dehydratase [Paracoccaceae bacterium]MCZ8083765.1 NAD(P)H-hydrate dehydratase [Paracoccaceae bacterium]
MTELLIAAQMRAIEAAAIASGAVTGLELMERAGRGVVEAIFAEWPELRATSHRAVVLCGPGNNGGDGFVVARLLKEWGWEVRVLAAAKPDAMPRDAAVNARRWWAYGAVEPLTERSLRRGPSADIYVDAIFGTGLTRPPEGEIARILAHLGGANGDLGYYQDRVVALDAPSCLCLDSGRSLMRGWAVPRARLTVTFDSLKAGHVLAEGPALSGRVVVVDIGIAPWRRMTNPRRGPQGWLGAMKPHHLGLVGPEPDRMMPFVPGRFPLPMLSKAGWAEDHLSHKFTHGHALILGGPAGRGGAARLVARGALRVGAGLVTVGCPGEALAENAARLDAVMLRVVPDGAGLARLLSDRRIGTVCVGPGLGVGPKARRLLGELLRTVQKGEVPPHLANLPEAFQRPSPPTRPKVVLDADALTILSREAGLFGALHDGCVLTPHAGEFARLFPDIAEKLAAPAVTGPAYSKVDATREAAARAGCVVLFKGADTVIAAPNGRCAINSAHYDRAAPWLATAGAGDVLAGFIAGLMARGFAPFDAACTGAWLHVECAREFGPGLIAEDLPEMLPAVFRRLGV